MKRSIWWTHTFAHADTHKHMYVHTRVCKHIHTHVGPRTCTLTSLPSTPLTPTHSQLNKASGSVTRLFSGRLLSKGDASSAWAGLPAGLYSSSQQQPTSPKSKSCLWLPRTITYIQESSKYSGQLVGLAGIRKNLDIFKSRKSKLQSQNPG